MKGRVVIMNKFRTHYIKDITESLIGETITVSGWVENIRDHGGVFFLDLRDEKLIVLNPKCKLKVNTVGEASFTIHKRHPYYGQLKKLKSIFEIADEIGVIFRGRMTNDSLDFHNGKAVDLEGAMAFLNDSYIEPFKFPEDFLEDNNYNSSSNVIEFFLGY